MSSSRALSSGQSSAGEKPALSLNRFLDGEVLLQRHLFPAWRRPSGSVPVSVLTAADIRSNKLSMRMLQIQMM